MSLALVRKEVREHGWVMAAVFLLDGLLLAGLLVNARDDGGRLVALTRFTAFCVTLTAVVLAGRLFTREFAARTQLWLEVLPLGRGRTLATKWLLGACSLLTVTWSAWLATVLWQRRTEVISWSDAQWPLLAATAWTLAAWSYAAVVALLGRYRFVSWLLLGLGAVALEEVAKVPLATLGMVRLVSDTVGMARAAPPLVGLLQALGLTALGGVTAWALTVPGPGAVAGLLSTRMTARERAFVVGALLVGFVIIFSLKRDPEKPPFSLTNAAHASARHAVVGVQPADAADEARAVSLANQLAADVDSLSDALGLEGRPRIFVLTQRGLDRETVERAKLGDASGIVLGAAPDADPVRVRSAALHALVDHASLMRAQKEDRHVLLDGLAAWWPLRDDAALLEREHLRLSALDVVRADALVSWDATAERVGACGVDALGAATVEALFARLGRPAALALLKSLFAKPKTDVRVLFETSPARQLAAAGASFETLASDVEATRLSATQRHAGELAARAPLVAQAVSSSDPSRGHTVEVTLQGATRWSVKAARLKPWAAMLHEDVRVDVRGDHTTVPMTLSRGEQVWVAVDVDDAALGCKVRALSTRLELP